MMIETYEQLIKLVEELGFMPLSHQFDPKLPCLTGVTPSNLWHTGEDTDPWVWKNRAAHERKLAYGCILNGFKGFVAPRLYPAFYAAFHRDEPQDAWEDGVMDACTWRLWQLFDDQPLISTADTRRLKPEFKVGRIDNSLVKLQQRYDVTLCGVTRKTNRMGEPYGWSINTYRRVQDWLGQSLAGNDWCGDMDEADAQDQILEQAAKNGADVDLVRSQLGWK